MKAERDEAAIHRSPSSLTCGCISVSRNAGCDQALREENDRGSFLRHRESEPAARVEQIGAARITGLQAINKQIPNVLFSSHWIRRETFEHPGNTECADTAMNPCLEERGVQTYVKWYFFSPRAEGPIPCHHFPGRGRLGAALAGRSFSIFSKVYFPSPSLSHQSRALRIAARRSSAVPSRR